MTQTPIPAGPAPPTTSLPPPQRSREEFHDHFHKNERVAFFSDGVFAIVVTLLVLELKVPPLAHPADARELMRAIGGMQHELLSFVLSFLFTINLWVSHNLYYKILTHVDNVVMWVNNLFLLFVCFIPFPTAVIGAYPDNPAAIELFGAVWFAIALLLFVMGRYALAHHMLSTHVDVVRFRQAIRVLGLLLPLSLAPLLVAPRAPMLAFSLYIAMALVGTVLGFWIKLAE